jgi:hypothetical protein
MKSKVIISLTIALLMLVTLATPALADRASGSLTPQGGEPGIGKYSIRTTHDNYLKVTVSLRGAMPDATYKVHVYSAAPLYFEMAGTFMTNKKGSGRFSGFAIIGGGDTNPKVFDSGSWSFSIRVYRLANQKFYGPVDEVTFK